MKHIKKHPKIFLLHNSEEYNMIVKMLLKRLKIYGHARNMYYKLNRINKRVESILEEETKYSFDKISSTDSFIGSLKISIHGIEKALIKDNQNYKHLENQCLNIISRLDEFLSKHPNYPLNSDIVKETVGITNLLINESKNSYNCSPAKTKLKEFQDKHDITEQEYHRIAILQKASSELNWLNWKEYGEFVKSRHSIRETTKEIISFDEIREIVSIAQICPSECNRQSIKIYYTAESEKIRNLFPDPQVTKDIANILIVTVNKTYYSSTEILQPWIDGGIFLESMVMAMHAHHLGACLFQCIKNTKRYYETKKVANIPDNEDIVAFIGYGRLKEQYHVISTHRKEVEEVLVDFSREHLSDIGGGDTKR